jgi:hypothetical protein
MSRSVLAFEVTREYKRPSATHVHTTLATLIEAPPSRPDPSYFSLRQSQERMMGRTRGVGRKMTTADGNGVLAYHRQTEDAPSKA